uniref:Uncharacterized protein n=1 Tax=Rhizophora mucronata TaxID=61149 RepID=A0A2P2Q8K3_RHIMU
MFVVLLVLNLHCFSLFGHLF